MGSILCEHCVAYCCRYIALPIETPTDKSDFDDVRWYLLHEGVTVFVEKGDWYICLQSVCRHLQSDFRCGIYDARPRICREYSTENCDYHSGDYGWDAHFTCPEHLDEYVRANPPQDAVRRGKAAKKGASAGNNAARKGGRAARNGSARVRTGLRAVLDPARSRARRRQPVPPPAVVDARGVPLPILEPRR